jgi:hypothetical protein
MRQLHKVQKINASGTTVPSSSSAFRFYDYGLFAFDFGCLCPTCVSYLILGQYKSNYTKAEIDLALLIKFHED